MRPLLPGLLTSADTLSLMIMEMCKPENYHRQLKLRKELWDADVGPDVEPQLSDVKRLPYLYCVIRETLRVYPPIPMTKSRIIQP
ncbi:Cytochrome P450 4V2 [Sporothrix bragantina]|uniref:Cytochrome P450 4V2 n=1 Tax=Sporothrix bragantina TaxID=671064 RepID=A0ABP0CE40_9PEZI